MKTILSTAYWPNLHYLYWFLHSEKTVIDVYEHYQKQSFRNRCQIMTANGPLNLSIPVKHLATKEFTADIEISYQEKWQIKHWRAIVSAYKNSPYFEHFEDELKLMYQNEPNLLVDFNVSQLRLILKLLRLKKEIALSTSYIEAEETDNDLRESIHPKLDFRSDKIVASVLMNPYYQTFEAKMKFVPNLSILDLLFNIGLETCAYLNYPAVLKH